MISTPDRQNAITLVDQAAAAGARRALACAELGLDERTCRRWRARDGAPEDRRPMAPRPAPSNALETVRNFVWGGVDQVMAKRS